MRLEGTQVETDIEEGTIAIRVKNTNAAELSRLWDILHHMFEQGVFNTRNGKVRLNFDGAGNLKGIEMDVVKWLEGKPITNRVAMYESALVELLG